ncbi:RDD family protein [Microbacterium sp. NPDC096154]|uniref:RDD family protein n=1 Tax=Microbacterium sp. NPDC096154 TaxID=3155549 RepID=UPI00331EF0F3
MTTPNPYGAPGAQPAPGSFPAPAQGHGGVSAGHPAASAPQDAAFPGWLSSQHTQQPVPQHAPAPGAAQPASGPLPGRPARLGRRAAAYAIDIAIPVLGVAVLVLIGALLVDAVGPVVGILFALLAWALGIGWWFVWTAMQGGPHGSIGMRLMQLRLVRLETGAPLGFGGAFIRNLIWGLAGSIIVGYFSVFFDKSGRRQGWHDLVAHAFMTDVRGEAGEGASSSVPAGGHAPAAPPVPVSPVNPAYGAATIAGAPGLPAMPPRPPLPPQPAAGAVTPATGPSDPGTNATGVPSSVPPAFVPPAPPVAPAPPAAPSFAQPPAAAGDDALIAFVPGITQDPPSGPVAPPAPPATSDLDEDTVLVRPEPEPEPDIEDTRIVAPKPSAMLEWDDGSRHSVLRRTLFGRNPAAEEGVDTVAVRDETLSLSKTHFEIDVTVEGAFVTDRHSTNGVTVVRAGQRIEAKPGERILLEQDDALEIGERIVTVKTAGRRGA